MGRDLRYLVLADVHANLEALEAVLASATDYDAVLFLGDLVGYGPNPNEAVERLRAFPQLTALLGNHDLAALGEIDLAAFNPVARDAAEWTGRRLSAENRAYLESLSPRVDAEDLSVAHASLRDPVWEYLEEPAQAAASFAAFEGPLALVGHTHVPRVFRANGTREVAVAEPGADQRVQLSDARWIINPGGVGQPRNGDPRAAYGILDTSARTFTFYRVPYDIAATQRKILDAGLPPALAARLSYGL